ncbi:MULTISPECIES: 16S rRNA (guanine(527)-N(7))-methyltransferase RsmG [unclassified Thioalkalivibrio]|uniref:16S rRNA (guanine(527)-N(7))-methyltransferase RsmG n=1 Tax=unclassified Thioalkalivibrio TaxID=2621013 RepID=UPI00038222B1|nr:MULTISPECIES: 16S rRNA (guanine(527)-N(7))-methyltransferase RsmG [unclassified Thioalkalivibrio]
MANEDTWRAELARHAPAAGLTEPAIDALVTWLSQLERWNRVHNLSAVRDPQQMVSRHVFDSLSLRPWLHGQRILDVGTGAGLPGLILALADAYAPDGDVAAKRRYCLLDSAAKRVRFLRHVIGLLRTENVEARHLRIEQFAPQAPFDTLVSRAFKAPAETLQRAGHLVAPQGRVLAMLGPADRAREALPAPWSYQAVEPVTIPGEHAPRHIAIIERTAP